MEQIKLRISRKILETLELLAKRRNHSIERVLKDSVNTELYFDTQMMEGFHILTQDPGTNETYHVIFTHMSES